MSTKDALLSSERQFFVLSEAGKPVYSKHGSDQQLASFFGVMQALISFVTQQDANQLYSIRAGNSLFVFRVAGPLIFVAVARGEEPESMLYDYISFVYDQIVSVLTVDQISKILLQQSNFDLRRLLGGADKYLDFLLDRIDCDPSFLLDSVRCLPLSLPIRQKLHLILSESASGSVFCAVIVAKSSIVTILNSSRKYSLQPRDLHVLLNLMMASSTNFTEGETWIPLCFPNFSTSGFLHCHISMLDCGLGLSLVLMSLSKESFFELSCCRALIEDKLRKSPTLLSALRVAVKQDSYSIQDLHLSAQVVHFLLKSKASHQFTQPLLPCHYFRASESRHLFLQYHRVRSVLLSSYPRVSSFLHGGDREVIWGVDCENYEVYLCLDPFYDKPCAEASLARILEWIRHENDRIFFVS